MNGKKKNIKELGGLKNKMIGTYWIWNYDPKRGKYFYNKDLSEVLGLEMDSEQKLILFHYRGGDQEEYWDYYEYKNNELVYIKEISN